MTLPIRIPILAARLERSDDHVCGQFRRQTQHPESVHQARGAQLDRPCRAAKLQGKNRTDFILDAARNAAEEALLDQALFVVSEEAYAEFVERLDRPPTPNPRLKRMMQTPAPWDER